MLAWIARPFYQLPDEYLRDSVKAQRYTHQRNDTNQRQARPPYDHLCDPSHDRMVSFREYATLVRSPAHPTSTHPSHTPKEAQASSQPRNCRAHRHDEAPASSTQTKPRPRVAYLPWLATAAIFASASGSR